MAAAVPSSRISLRTGGRRWKPAKSQGSQNSCATNHRPDNPKGCFWCGKIPAHDKAHCPAFWHNNVQCDAEHANVQCTLHCTLVRWNGSPLYCTISVPEWLSITLFISVPEWLSIILYISVPEWLSITHYISVPDGSPLYRTLAYISVPCQNGSASHCT